MNYIYVMFILEYMADDICNGVYEGKKLVQEVHEEYFTSKSEMKTYVKINFINSPDVELIEKYKGSRKTEINYIYRIVYR